MEKTYREGGVLINGPEPTDTLLFEESEKDARDFCDRRISRLVKKPADTERSDGDAL